MTRYITNLWQWAQFQTKFSGMLYLKMSSEKICICPKVVETYLSTYISFKLQIQKSTDILVENILISTITPFHSACRSVADPKILKELQCELHVNLTRRDWIQTDELQYFCAVDSIWASFSSVEVSTLPFSSKLLPGLIWAHYRNFRMFNISSTYLE